MDQESMLRWKLGTAYRVSKQSALLDERIKRYKGNVDLVEAFRLQKVMLSKELYDVAKILDYLPMGSDERLVCEMRYMDFKAWSDIQKAMLLSKAQCHRRHSSAITYLLKIPAVCTLLDDFGSDYKDYVLMKEGVTLSERAGMEIAFSNTGDKARVTVYSPGTDVFDSYCASSSSSWKLMREMTSGGVVYAKTYECASGCIDIRPRPVRSKASTQQVNDKA